MENYSRIGLRNSLALNFVRPAHIHLYFSPFLHSKKDVLLGALKQIKNQKQITIGEVNNCEWLKTTLETSGEDVKNTLETGGEDVKTTLETGGENALNLVVLVNDFADFEHVVSNCGMFKIYREVPKMYLDVILVENYTRNEWGRLENYTRFERVFDELESYIKPGGMFFTSGFNWENETFAKKYKIHSFRV
jgi:hypothetical protein